MKQKINRQLKEKEKKLIFKEKSHQYFVGGHEFTSVTTVIKKFKPPFDPDGMLLKRCAIKEETTPELLQEKWNEIRDTAAQFGTKIHNFAEQHILGNLPSTTMMLSNKEKQYALQVVSCLLDCNLDIIKPEVMVYNEMAGIAGQVDLITMNDDGSVDIYDWKTNKDAITKENRYNSYMLEPFKHLPDITYYHYALQLSLYKFLLLAWNIPVRDAWVIQIKNDSYEIIDMPYLEEEVLKIIEVNGRK